jgi:biotin carboxyl carrier protein
MKMETRVAAPRSGEVTAILAEAGQVVEAGQAIAEIA